MPPSPVTLADVERSMRPWLVVALFVAAPVRAEESLSVLPRSERDPRTGLRAYLLAEAQKHFDARRAAVAALKMPADLHRRQEMLKGRFRDALGGFPEKTPLKPRIVGKIRGAGFTIEKVIYESRPDHHVTANLYLPEGKGPFPGVLMPIGHSANGKAAEGTQRTAILLAKNGIAALAYDPIGQGERRQLLDSTGKPAIKSSTSEHTMTGVGALLAGWNTASYRVWDGIRSLDYLAGREEIDAKRLGCTGCSGGGTLTSYLMTLDERISVAAPACYITSLEQLFATLGPQDAEQNITGQVAFGMEHADYLSMRAPKPTLVCCSTQDFFDIKGTWTSFREAKRLFVLAGHGERIDICESEGRHGFHRPQREAMVRWMRRWLLGKDDAPVEEAATLRKDAELQCTRTGQVLDSLGGVSVFQLNARRAKELAEQRRRGAGGAEELRKEAARLAGVRLPVPAAKVVEHGRVARDGYRIRKIAFETEAGIAVPGLFFERSERDRGQLVLYVHGDGKAVDAQPGGAIERLVKAGQRVLALDLRGLGELAPGAGRPGPFGVDTREAFLALHLNRPLLGQRCHDLLAVIAKVAKESPEGIDVVGIGKAGPIVLHAAALEPRIKRVTLERALLSWSSVAARPISHDQLTNVVPGALAIYDLPDLAALLAPRPLTLRAAVDPVGEAVPREVLEKSCAGIKAAYAKRKADRDLVLEVGKP
jgi:cephalosporin-C deacetylase-like acetyl esterase